jgi:hypothetical protein
MYVKNVRKKDVINVIKSHKIFVHVSANCAMNSKNKVISVDRDAMYATIT